MKKILAFILGSIIYPLAAVPAFADDISLNPCNTGNDISKMLCSISTDITGTIQRIVLFLIVLAVIVTLVYLLYGGIKWVMSKGEKTEVEAARNHITAAITGLIIVFLAIFIVSLVMTLFGLDITKIALPKIVK